MAINTFCKQLFKEKINHFSAIWRDIFPFIFTPTKIIFMKNYVGVKFFWRRKFVYKDDGSTVL